MIGNFTYDGVNAYTTFGLICKSVTRPILPARKSNLVTFAHTSKFYDYGYVAYELFNLVMKVQFLGKDYNDLRERGHAIGAWLGGDPGTVSNPTPAENQWRDLSIEGDTYLNSYGNKAQVVYKAKVEEEVVLDTIFEFGEADITFLCQPLAITAVSVKNLHGDGYITFNYPTYPRG